MSPKKSWLFSEFYNADASELISKELDIPMLPARVLASRGAKDGLSAKRILDTSTNNLNDPMLLPDVEKACGIIKKALAENRKIAVYGDYDVDGVSATSIMIKYLRSKNANCIYYIPDRLNEGYGVTNCALDKLHDEGVELLITVDTGITAFDETDYAHKLGMTVIITDHHECKDILPDAEAVINPKRPDSVYPFKDLAGVGVAFKLVFALEGPENFKEVLDKYSAFASLGTISDLMPLTDENRVIADYGLKILGQKPFIGYRALARHADLDEHKMGSAISISYVMAPRINAAGRFGCAEKTVELFLTESENEADLLAGDLCEMNRQRQCTEQAIRESALEKIAKECDIENDRAIVLWDENWHHGVIGVVASKLADQLGRPVILVCLKGDEARGSGRSIEGFNLFSALQATSEYLLQYGGHELATGLIIQKDKLEDFRKAFLEYAAKEIDLDQCVPTLCVDCETEPSDYSIESIDALSMLEPFGMANPQPVFCLRDMRVCSITPIGNGKHMRLMLAKSGSRFDVVQFNASADDADFMRGSFVDVVFTADINTYRGRSVQFTIRDIRPSRETAAANKRDINFYLDYMSGKKITGPQAVYLLPNRSEQVAVWHHLTGKLNEKNKYRRSAEYGALRVRSESGVNMNPGKFLICCAAFAESGLFEFRYENNTVKVNMPENVRKCDLSCSKIIAGLKKTAAIV